MIDQAVSKAPDVDYRSVENSNKSVHDKLAIDNRLKFRKLQAENEIKQLNQKLEERIEVKNTISQNINDTTKGIL